MDRRQCHQMALRGIGRPAEIRTNRGTVHRGIVDRVTNDRVYLRPMANQAGRGSYGGFGYGLGGNYSKRKNYSRNNGQNYNRSNGPYYGPYGGGYGWVPAVTGFALGAIVSLAFLAFFF